MLVKQEDRLSNYCNITEELANRNNRLRKSIPPKFIPLMRPQLIELEKCYAPALSEITWLSLSIESYFDKIKKTLDKIEAFLKMITDIDYSRITQNLLAIQNTELIVLPDDAVSPDKLWEMNARYRKKVGTFILNI